MFETSFWNTMKMGLVKYYKSVSLSHNHCVFHDRVDNGNFECSLCYINENVYKGEDYFTGYRSPSWLSVSGGLFLPYPGGWQISGALREDFCVCLDGSKCSYPKKNKWGWYTGGWHYLVCLKIIYKNSTKIAEFVTKLDI